MSKWNVDVVFQLPSSSTSGFPNVKSPRRRRLTRAWLWRYRKWKIITWWPTNPWLTTKTSCIICWSMVAKVTRKFFFVEMSCYIIWNEEKLYYLDVSMDFFFYRRSINEAEHALWMRYGGDSILQRFNWTVGRRVKGRMHASQGRIPPWQKWIQTPRCPGKYPNSNSL